MRNNHKVLSIALLFLAVTLFGCGGDYSILVINTPPNPDIVASPITLSNLSPTNITLFNIMAQQPYIFLLTNPAVLAI